MKGMIKCAACDGKKTSIGDVEVLTDQKEELLYTNVSDMQIIRGMVNREDHYGPGVRINLNCGSCGEISFLYIYSNGGATCTSVKASGLRRVDLL